MKVTDLVTEFAQPIVESFGCRLWDVEYVREGSERYLRLYLDKEDGAWEHKHFFDLPGYLRSGDCLILNNSRVLPARLLGNRVPGGGACEVLLLIDRGENVWECLVRPGKKMRKGAQISFGNGELTAEVVDELPGLMLVIAIDAANCDHD